MFRKINKSFIFVINPIHSILLPIYTPFLLNAISVKLFAIHQRNVTSTEFLAICGLYKNFLKSTKIIQQLKSINEK